MLEYDNVQTTRMGTGCCKHKSRLLYDLLRLSPSPIDRYWRMKVRLGVVGCVIEKREEETEGKGKGRRIERLGRKK